MNDNNDTQSTHRIPSIQNHLANKIEALLTQIVDTNDHYSNGPITINSKWSKEELICNREKISGMQHSECVLKCIDRLVALDDEGKISLVKKGTDQ